MNEALSSPEKKPSPVWFTIAGILTILVGIASIAFAEYASAFIAQFIGAFCLVSGLFLFFSAIFAKTRNHRVLDLFSAALRIIVGVMLLSNLFAAVLALTLLLACIFLAEGLVGIFYAFRLRGKNPAWVWILLNGIVALVLGGLLFAQFPSDAAWAIGLLFGINAVFLGFSLVMFASALPKAQET